MLTWSTKRRLVKFCSVGEPLSNVVGLTALTLATLRYFPIDALLPSPATGGDMGSHFWPLYVLVEHSLPQWEIRSINPGNLGGEPLFVHYFPMPFLIMAGIAQLIHVAAAYNIGTLLPLVVFPFAVFLCIRAMGYRFPTPLIVAGIAQFFLFNESFSMWGGNSLSLLAGQFAHLYALVFLLFGLAALSHEVRYDKPPLGSALMFSAVATSHGYVLLGIPAFALSYIFFTTYRSLHYRFRKLFVCGVYSALLSVWFLVPMLDNGPWTTPFPIEWISEDIIKEAVNRVLFPVIGAIPVILSLVLVLRMFAVRPKAFEGVVKMTLFWLLPIGAYIGFYFVLPTLGLVDTRAIPQALLFICLLGALLFCRLLVASGRVAGVVLALPLLFGSMYWLECNMVKFGPWLKWNYSGWETKTLYPSLAGLSDELRGDFSDPRVVYENHSDNARAGTIRVFEMLPYFAGRATLESVYLQATILAPMAFYIQAYVSKTPSCPFRQFDCPRYDLKEGIARMHLLGVSDYIAITDELKESADSLVEEGLLSRGKTFEPWQLYRLVDAPSLVEVFESPPKVVPESEWRDEFIAWFQKYDSKNPYLIVNELTPEAALAELGNEASSDDSMWQNDSCEPELEVGFGEMKLRTPCPGSAHYLRVAYHPAWGTDTTDVLFPVSPGFIGIVPSENEVKFKFGQRTLWLVCSVISWAALLVLAAVTAVSCIRRR